MYTQLQTQVDTDDSVLSLLNGPGGAANLSEEATKLTIDPLLSGGYGHITQAAGYLDCRF